MAVSLAKRLWLGALLLSVWTPARAQNTAVIPLATSSTWRLEGSNKIPVEELRAWGADVAIEREYGVSVVERRVYVLYPEEQRVDAFIEKASDPSAAYGLLTVYATGQMSQLKDLPLTRLGPASALLVRGSNFIRIVQAAAPPGKVAKPVGTANTSAASSEHPFAFSLGELRSLLAQVGGEGPSSAELEARPAAPPLAGLVQGSEKYLLGEAAARRVLPAFPVQLIGFSMGAEVRMATYRAGEGNVRVLAISYPTPEIARTRFTAMENSLPLNPPHSQAPSAVYGKETGSFIILVLDAPSAQVATKLLSRLNSSEHVAWDRPYPGDEPIIIQMVKLVIANLILTFILAGFALGGGVIFFITKRIAMKWFPRTTFGQPDEATIIKLHLE